MDEEYDLAGSYGAAPLRPVAEPPSSPGRERVYGSVTGGLFTLGLPRFLCCTISL